MASQPSTADAEAIKTMQLYKKVDRIMDELREAGYADDAPLTVTAVESFDQYHYLGTAAVDHAADALQLGAGARVLDIGAGIGGPARHLADKYGASVTALELQSDLHETGEYLTKRCNLENLVSHRCGDVLQFVPSEQYDALVSWLVFLHISDRRALFAKCAELCKQDGCMYIEDFFMRDALTERERKQLQEDVYCAYLPTREQYEQHLQEAGFTITSFADMSEPWTAFVAERHDSYVGNCDRHRRVVGDAVYKSQEHFFRTVRELFEGGHVGGARILVQRKA